MARLRSGLLSTTQTIVIGIVLAEVALLPVLPRVAQAYGPVPAPAATAPATAPPAPAVAAPATPADAPPPYPPPSTPPPGYPPAAAPPPGYPPAATSPPPPAYPYPPRRVPYGFDAAEAAAAGERDGAADSSGAAWFMLGCLLGGIGVIIAYVVDPTPPPARYIGRSAEWVMAYSQAYKSAGRSSQGKSAILGCLLISAVFVALVAASASSASAQ